MFAGLQSHGTNPNGSATTRKVMVFSEGGSTWGGTLGPTFTEGVDGHVASDFDGASGTSVIVAYDWVVGRRYRIRIISDGDDGSGHPGWACYVLDTVTMVDTLIAHIWVPAGWGNILAGGAYTTTCFSERFGPSAPASCSDIHYVSGVFSDFSANSGASQPVSHANHWYGTVYCTNSRITDL